MKQKIFLGSSTSVLIGVVIAILALLRGPAQIISLLTACALWGLWTVFALLRPAWQTNQLYRHREEQAAKEQGVFSGRKVANLLLCHVNYRITDHLKSVYPDVRWEWTMGDPALFIVQGGTGRLRIFGVPDYEYADVTLDRMGGLSCSMVKVVPVQGAPSGQSPIDPQAWYELEGRSILDRLIADLRSRSHNSLTLNEDGSISIQPVAGGDEITKGSFASFPEKVYWPRLADVLEQEGLTTDIQTSRIVVSW